MKLGSSTNQYELYERAKAIWQAFNHKCKNLTENQATLEEKLNFHLKKHKRSLALYQDDEIEVAKTIVDWWRYQNPNDVLLGNELEQNPWQSALFRDPETHYNGLNLFAAGNITWQQQATLSMIIETKQVFGDFEAIPLLNAEGTDFSEKAKPLIQDFIRYSPLHFASSYRHPSNCYLADEETQLLFALVRQLPKSEQFLFHFKEQHCNEIDPQGAPSKDVIARYLYSRLLHRSGNDYQGVLVLSHGIRNAIGLSHYDVDDWAPLIPRLGPQSIDDVDFHVVNGARPTVSGESQHLGFIAKEVNIHGSLKESPDQFAHDEYHSWVASILGNKVLKAIDELICLTRGTFGVRWSKDIWILRDGDLSKLQNHDRDVKDNSPQYTTRLFADCLNFQYASVELLNCTQEVQRFMEGRPLLLGTDKYPSQILLNFALDLVLNAEKWKRINILDDEKLYLGVMPRLIQMVKYLRKLGFISEHNSMNNKRNILMFDYFVRSQGPCYSETPLETGQISLAWNNWQEPAQVPKDIICQMQQMGLTADEYVPTVYNKELIFGFKKGEKGAQKPENKKTNKKRDRQGEIEVLIEQNPELRHNKSWLNAQFIIACETENTDDVEYVLDNLRNVIDYELLFESLSKVKSMRFFDWYINRLKILKDSHDKRFPVDYMDITVDDKMECSDDGPRAWTSDYLLSLKESDNEDAQIKLNQMEKQFVAYLHTKRESIIAEEKSSYSLKKNKT